MKPIRLLAAAVLALCAVAGSAAAQEAYTDHDPATGARITRDVTPQTPLPTGGAAAVISAALTRPANTTAYTANTGLANATSGATFLTFTNVCSAAGKVILIPTVRVIDFANQTTKLSGVLWLFNAAPASPINDNATFSITSADMANMVGEPISFTASTVANQGSGSAGITVAAVTGTTFEAICGASANLFGLVQVTNAYAPVSAEQFTFTIKTLGVN